MTHAEAGRLGGLHSGKSRAGGIKGSKGSNFVSKISSNLGGPKNLTYPSKGLKTKKQQDAMVKRIRKNLGK